IYDRAAKTTSKRARPGKQAFPFLVPSTRLGYLDWAEVHPEPKLSSYALRVGDIRGAVSGDQTIAPVKNITGQYVLPAGRAGYVEWVERPIGPAVLWRVPADLTSAPASVSGLDGLDIYAPASAATYTLVGTMPLNGGAVVVRGVAR